MNKIKLFNGLSIAFQQFGIQNQASPFGSVLCLHGWLDNSNSFSFVGPYLADKGFHVIAIDFISHGFSDHYTNDAQHINLVRVQQAKGVCDALQLDKNINLVGKYNVHMM